MSVFSEQTKSVRFFVAMQAELQANPFDELRPQEAKTGVVKQFDFYKNGEKHRSARLTLEQSDDSTYCVWYQHYPTGFSIVISDKHRQPMELRGKPSLNIVRALAIALA